MAVSFGSNKLITNADMSASFQSDVINLHNKTGFAIHAIFTGAPAGSLYIAVSIDGSTWDVLPDSPSAIAAAGDVFYNVKAPGYLLARLQYAVTSGTGSLNAFFSVKG